MSDPLDGVGLGEPRAGGVAFVVGSSNPKRLPNTAATVEELEVAGAARDEAGREAPAPPTGALATDCLVAGGLEAVVGAREAGGCCFGTATLPAETGVVVAVVVVMAAAEGAAAVAGPARLVLLVLSSFLLFSWRLGAIARAARRGAARRAGA